MDMTHGAEGKANYLQRVEEGHEPWAAATTYEYLCGDCGGQTFTDLAGGNINCDCDEPRPDRLSIFLILAGRRELMGTAAVIAAL